VTDATDAARDALEAAYRKHAGRVSNKYELFGYADDLPSEIGKTEAVSLAADVLADPPTTETAETATNGWEEAAFDDTTPGVYPEKDPDKYRQAYLSATEAADREPWEYVEEEALREALDSLGFAGLVDDGTLHKINGWLSIDVSDDDNDPRYRWYYPSGTEPAPEEFRRFDQLLTNSAPDGYTPHYFRCAPASKDPATQYGSWKSDEARLTVEEAVEWMKEGGNVGIAGRGGCRGCGARASPFCPRCKGEGNDDQLVNVDIDDDEKTTPDDVPASLRARSRSRTGWHTWYFDESDEIPNIPTDEYGEVRADWQYVVAPGSFVASTSEGIPEGAEAPGYYTVEDAVPVSRIEYNDLPEVFIETVQEIAEAEEEAEATNDPESNVSPPTEDRRSAVFDIDATDLVTGKSASDRFTSIFHASDTGSNMSVSGKVLHCWRHLVAHGGLQALAALSDVEHVKRFGCKKIGAPHKTTTNKNKRTTDAGPNKLKNDWRLIWGAWHEAKQRNEIPDDDPIPYIALVELAIADDLLDREDLVERDDEGKIVDPADTDGDTYTAFPKHTYNVALSHVEEEYGVSPGRKPVGGDTDSTDGTPYYNADLSSYVDGDPWSDPDTMLQACLSAREAGAVPEAADPPALALIPITRDLLGVSTPSEATKEEAAEVYREELTPEQFDGETVLL
jgi:hypothetical protein